VKTASMDNFAKCEANTCTARDVLHQPLGVKARGGGCLANGWHKN
jgi:hypothetical protein